MTGTEIIAKYELQVDDASELSSDEELDLANNIYDEVCIDRDWEWLKKTYSGTTSTSVAYVALPSDFRKLSVNLDNNSVVFVGTQFKPYQVIPFSSAGDHRDQDGFCYIDIVNQRLVFTKQPTAADPIEYDYIKIQPALTLATSPLFRETFHKVIAFGMASRFNMLEQSNKATSYATENKILYLDVLNSMATEDALIKLSI